jgi:hypothetical protein
MDRPLRVGNPALVQGGMTLVRSDCKRYFHFRTKEGSTSWSTTRCGGRNALVEVKLSFPCFTWGILRHTPSSQTRSGDYLMADRWKRKLRSPDTGKRCQSVMLPLRREELTSDEDPQLSGAAMKSVYSPASSTCPLPVAGCIWKDFDATLSGGGKETWNRRNRKMWRAQTASSAPTS